LISYLSHLKKIALTLVLAAALSSCGGSSGGISAPAASPSADSASLPEAAPTVASAAPTPQPTQPLVPTGTVWIRGQAFLQGSDTPSDCEEKFLSAPDISVWRKSAQTDWQWEYTISKPEEGVDSPDLIHAYQCGKFGAHFGFWGPSTSPCLNQDLIKFVADYKDANRKVYRGESKTYSCSDRDKPEAMLILLSPVDPMPLMIDSSKRQWLNP